MFGKPWLPLILLFKFVRPPLFERGYAMPSLKRLAFLAEVLDASIHDLMGASSGLTGDVVAEMQ
jgi:hypothetical protein